MSSHHYLWLGNPYLWSGLGLGTLSAITYLLPIHEESITADAELSGTLFIAHCSLVLGVLLWAIERLTPRVMLSRLKVSAPPTLTVDFFERHPLYLYGRRSPRRYL